MKSKLLIILSVLLLGIAGCDPTRFSVISDHDIDCRIYSDHRQVETTQTGFTMLPGACVSTRYLWATHYKTSFRLTLQEGDGVQILLRPEVQEQILDSGIVLTLSRKGYSLVNGDTLLASGRSPILAAGKTEIFRAYSDEGYLELTLGCDTLYK